MKFYRAKNLSDSSYTPIEIGYLAKNKVDSFNDEMLVFVPFASYNFGRYVVYPEYSEYDWAYLSRIVGLQELSRKEYRDLGNVMVRQTNELDKNRSRIYWLSQKAGKDE